MTAATSYAVGKPRVRALAMSKLEAKFRQQLVDGGLSNGCYRETVFHPTRGWRLDFSWPSLLVGVEVDGGTWQQGRHNRGAGWEMDAEKFAEAAILGWRIIHVNAKMIRSGEALALTARLVASAIPVDTPLQR